MRSNPPWKLASPAGVVTLLGVLVSRVLVVCLAVCLALAAAGCAEERNDGTKPTAEALPELTLDDDTPELLLTWIDERGDTQTGVSLSEVPEGSKALVRVITKDAGHGASFYVADLTHKRDDGSYPVRVMSRSEWESIIEKRRVAYRGKHAPPPPADLPPDHPPVRPEPPSQPHGAVQAVIYGAEWCGPCHQAAAYLRKRGIAVVEHDIEKHPKYAAEMQRKLKSAGMGGGTIPVIDVGGVILRGFSPRALDQAVKRALGGTNL